jgi:hypothetical protein
VLSLSRRGNVDGLVEFVSSKKVKMMDDDARGRVYIG